MKTLDTVASPGSERFDTRPDGASFAARSKVWLERDGKVVLSEWRIDLLAAIDETGSLVHAAEKLEVPYRTASYKLKEAEQRMGFKLVEAQSGGADGGSSRLTPAGRDLVERFRRVTQGVATLANARFRAEFGDLDG